MVDPWSRIFPALSRGARNEEQLIFMPFTSGHVFSLLLMPLPPLHDHMMGSHYTKHNMHGTHIHTQSPSSIFNLCVFPS